MIGLPSLESRELILETLLSKENVKVFDDKELATMTEGYTGCDRKNLCLTAAHHPVRELIQKQCTKELERKRKTEEEQGPIEASGNREENEDPTITLRSFNMEDLKLAKNQVAASFTAEGSVMNELKQWNELYGESDSRKQQQLSDFLQFVALYDKQKDLELNYNINSALCVYASSWTRFSLRE